MATKVPSVGLNVSSDPDASTATHCVVDRQETLVRTVPTESIAATPTELIVPLVGSKVISVASAETAVHWVRLGHDIPSTTGATTEAVLITVAEGLPLELGVKLISFGCDELGASMATQLDAVARAGDRRRGCCSRRSG